MWELPNLHTLVKFGSTFWTYSIPCSNVGVDAAEEAEVNVAFGTVVICTGDSTTAFRAWLSETSICHILTIS